MMRKISKIIECLAAGFFLGKGSWQIAYLKLNEFYDNNTSQIPAKAIQDIIFINRNYQILDYLDVTDITTLMIPITFLIFGLIITADYLRIPPGSVGFLAARTDNIMRLHRLIYGNTTKYIMLYVLSYVFAIGRCSGSITDLSVLGMIAVYVLALMLVSRICLLFYLNGRRTIAVIYAITFILLLYMIDIYIMPVHLVLYNAGSCQQDDIMMLILEIIVVNIANRVLTKRRSIYVA